MEDAEIVELFWEREEDALRESMQKYERYCLAVAGNILGSEDDARECVNDAYLAAWQAIPPARPENLLAYLGACTRNIALNRLGGKARRRGSRAGVIGICRMSAERLFGGAGTQFAQHHRMPERLFRQTAEADAHCVRQTLLEYGADRADRAGVRHQGKFRAFDAESYPPKAAEVSGKGGY